MNGRRLTGLKGLLAMILLAMAGGFAATAQASTGSYQVTACNAAPEAVNHSWAWSTTDTSTPSHYAEHENCPYRTGGSGGTTDQQGGLSTTDALALESGAPPGTSAGWTFAAPAGTTITGLTYERYLGYQFEYADEWSPALRADGEIVGDESCADSSGSCIVGGPPGKGTEPAAITGLSAHDLSLSILCEALEGEVCVTGASEHEVWAAMYGATVTLSDTTPPTLGTPSGPLWEAGRYDGYHKGSESVSVEAQDVGGGIQSIVLSADGQPVDTYNASCNYTYPQPCPLSTGPQTLTLNTTALADGTHTLTLAAIDAAGNESTLASTQITIDNNPPGAPVDLAATATAEGGSTFTATWADPSGQVAPITEATYQVCPAPGTAGSCGTATAAAAAGPASVTVPGPGTWTLAVWLTDAAGNSSPANAATVSLTVPEPKSGGEGGFGPGGEGGESGKGGKSGGSGKGGGGEGDSGKGGGSSKGNPDGGHSSSGGKAPLRLREKLRGRKLIVHVQGPKGQQVRVSYIARRGGRRVASCSKRVTLRHGRARVLFRLGARVAARVAIVVKAKLPGRPAVVSRLQRKAGTSR